MSREELIFVSRLTFQLLNSNRLKANKERLAKRFDVSDTLVKEVVNKLVTSKYLSHSEGYLKLTKETKEKLKISKAKKLTNSDFTPPTLEEVIKEVLSKKDVGRDVAKEIAEYFISYYEDRDWRWGKYERPVKNWKSLLSRTYNWTVIKEMLTEDEKNEDGLFTKIK